MAALPLRMRNSRICPYLDPCFPYGLVFILLSHFLLLPYISPFQGFKIANNYLHLIYYLSLPRPSHS